MWLVLAKKTEVISIFSNTVDESGVKNFCQNWKLTLKMREWNVKVTIGDFVKSSESIQTSERFLELLENGRAYDCISSDKCLWGLFDFETLR